LIVGRKRQGRILNVYVGSSKVGQYARAPSSAASFRYDPDWLSSDRAFPISVSMPLSDRVWSGEAAASYFDGLLPDDRTVREKIAAREQAESAGIFDLLAVIGRDCVGALRFVPEGLHPGDPREMEYRPLTDAEIAARLVALATNPLGPTPTSHIFKPAMKEGPDGADFSDTPWNEWLCLVLCRALGLETANAEVRLFDDKPVIVVERFDRTWQECVLYRLPQEDLCQALGVPLMQKYQSNGGPGIVGVLGLLNGVSKRARMIGASFS
jgi:serine/threonine-protein kinase HipA